MKNYKKIKCRVCGHKFQAEKKNLYFATKNQGVVDALSKGQTIIECFDCPMCGCQQMVGVREPEKKSEVKK